MISTDLRLNEPRYATLPNIMKARKAARNSLPQPTSVSIAPRLTTLKVHEPPKRSAGIRVADVAELVSKLKRNQVI